MEMAQEQELILVLDFGSQYNQLITRRIREMGVYSELHDHEISVDEIKRMNPKGIILSGGPNSVYEEGSFTIDPEIYNLGIPVLGICYGMQLTTKLLGGKVERANEREYGKAIINAKSDELFFGLPAEQTVWMSHSDKVIEIPDGFEVIADSPSTNYAAIEDKKRRIYGVQFHPEVRHTEYGNDLLRNFVRRVCKCTGEWTMENFIDIEVEKIRKRVGDRKVLCAMSGGVDSSVVAVLLHKAIGDQLTCIFVDHGLLRKGEGDMVMEQFGEGFDMNIIRVNAQERFMDKLKGVSDPEQKRKIIGNEFVYVFDDEAAKLTDVDFLAQGTLYTDVIESGTKTAQTIKSHHNVGGLPEDMEFELIEPINTLFKDEVRVLGEITEDKLEIVRESDAILREVVREEGLERDIWQYFTVLPGIQSVGVMGDYRTYDHTVGIRAVTSIDGMTSDFARIDWEVLQKISSRIVNEVDHVNRVVYDITSKPPSTIEWE
ncbi:glutamine-hydrolyzing GMP synthase [Staphylococcus haemolyticus]|uniref:glutamine-hydrolyzing GMP synthase n=1 Tax=Staphylococcus haemolyticus TaxID=1283 RepID=UPI002DBF2A56|nr:glutamine-hydrolyzing GMP synthase [Staphylococcus haemolyticus]WRV64646.1 glutamine-hydrolyzing GMP synthase [Staphylococcus haemolyticus]